MGEGFCVPHSTKCIIPHNELAADHDLNAVPNQSCDCEDTDQCHPNSGSAKKWCSCEIY